MCEECGCSRAGEVRIAREPEPLEHAREQAHGPHERQHPHGAREESTRPHQTLALSQPILEKNERQAERNRGFFQAKGLLVLNVVSSPGSGKTTFIARTAISLGSRLRTGVIVGDLATDNDAARLRAAHIPVVQITTGTVCHLEAEMVMRAAENLDLNSLDLLIIENVGNLVCPASFDLGEHLRVVLLSVPEGEDKPLKYPPIFHSADALIVNKIDLAQACEFDREKALANIGKISHHARIFEVSSRRGDGIEEWCAFLIERHKMTKH